MVGRGAPNAELTTCGLRHAASFAGARERCADEVAEQRRGTRRAGLELGVELARHEPGVVGKLDDLHQPPGLDKAVQFDSYGGIDVLEVRDVSRPVPGAGEVLVEVRAAGINSVRR